jgi:hypothetical protein
MLFWGYANEQVAQTVLKQACCRRTVGGKLDVFWPQVERQTTYAISLLKHVVVVLSKSEGP